MATGVRRFQSRLSLQETTTRSETEGPTRRSARVVLAPKRLICADPIEASKKRQRAVKPVKPVKATDGEGKKEEEKSDSDSDIENSDVENSDVEKTSHRGLSAYELERLETIRQNQAFLASIKLFQATEDLKQSLKPKPSQRGLVRSKVAVRDVLPSRKSLRLQNKEADAQLLPPKPQDEAEGPTRRSARISLAPKRLMGSDPEKPSGKRLLLKEEAAVSATSEGKSDFDTENSDVEKEFESEWSKKPSGPLPMAPVNMEGGTRLPPELLTLCSENTTIKEERVELDLNEYRSALKSMRLTEDRVVKVVKSRITSAAFHPCTSSLLMATGDKLGYVGLWNLDGGWGDDGVMLFEPHTRAVSCMAFSRAHPTHLLSLSFDGSLRCMDLDKAIFDDVYDDEDRLKAFDFLSPDCLTLVVGTWFGVAIVDRRTPGNSHESFHDLDPRVGHCVSVHPVHKQYFAVSERRVVSIYDSRCLKKTNSQPVSQMHGHSLSISSAYFSPSTGNRVLSTCMDERIRIYDTSAMITEAPLLTSIRNDMRPNRWLTNMSAVWDPKQEDCFAVGSMARPRRLQVFHESGSLQRSFTDDDHLTTVQSITAFHPRRNALLGGNSSGRLHVFTD